MISTPPNAKPVFNGSLRAIELGFTLTELIIAAGLTTIVLAAASTGLVTLLNANQAAEQRQGQRQELERAMAFISDDIRAATLINQETPGGPTVSADTALARSTAPYRNSIVGTPVLYLEIPIDCSGVQIDDQVTYEVRTKQESFPLDYKLTEGDLLWRGPYLIYRHGRIPGLNGQVNDKAGGCPQATSKVLIDGILNANNSETPSCGATGTGIRNVGSATLSGLGGFYTCVEGTQVALLLRGNANPTPSEVAPLTLVTMVQQRSNLNPTSRGLCVVPDLVGTQNAVAKSMVTEAKLVHNSIGDPSLSIDRDTVASQLPAPNARLLCGQIVTFTYRP